MEEFQELTEKDFILVRDPKHDEEIFQTLRDLLHKKAHRFQELREVSIASD